jgi:hypothetical protein
VFSNLKDISSGLPCNPIEDGIQPESWQELFTQPNILKHGFEQQLVKI